MIGGDNPHDVSQGLVPIEGESMRPFLRSGDSVRVSWETKGLPREGEIVCFRSQEGKWIVHRVIGVDETTGQFLTKGDFAIQLDPLASNVLWGRCEAVQKKGRSHPKTLQLKKRDRFIAKLSRESMGSPLSKKIHRAFSLLLGFSRRFI